MTDYYQTVFFILAGIIGLCVGSFLNVVIYRVPLHMSIAFPGSHCPKCNYQLKWYDNIPVLSYIMLGGKCRQCKEHISFRYTLVELGNTILWLLCGWIFKENLIYASIACIICSVCICICFIDLEHMIIPDRFQIILMVLGVAAIWFDKSVSHWSHLIGLLAGFGSFWLVGFLASKVYKREALGGGDIKLAACMGFILGWQKLILAMLLASVIGSIVMIICRKKDEHDKEFPFGPFLTGALIISMVFGTAIMNWYIGLIS